MTGSRKKNKSRHPNQRLPSQDRATRVRRVQDENRQNRDELAKWHHSLHEWENSQQQRDRMKCRKCYQKDHCECGGQDVLSPVTEESDDGTSTIRGEGSPERVRDGPVSDEATDAASHVGDEGSAAAFGPNSVGNNKQDESQAVLGADAAFSSAPTDTAAASESASSTQTDQSNAETPTRKGWWPSWSSSSSSSR